MSVKIVWLIELRVNETYSRVWVGKHLCETFPV